jgi:hypothetical protein
MGVNKVLKLVLKVGFYGVDFIHPAQTGSSNTLR